MNKMLGVFGFNLVTPLEVQFRVGKTPEKMQIKNREKTMEAFGKFIENHKIN